MSRDGLYSSLITRHSSLVTRHFFPFIPQKEASTAAVNAGRETDRGRWPAVRFFGKKRSESVLVVDDEPGVQKLLNQILTRDRYHVTVAGSLAEAQVEATQASPDLVLLDF